MTRRLRTILLAAAALLGLPALLEGIFVAPHAVFLDEDDRAGQVTLGNDNDEAEEVTIDLVFGYQDTDSVGTPFIRFVDDPGTKYPSAADWIRAFPRRLRLEPGDRQTLRLLANPPDDLPEGEYWARLIVAARGATVPIETGDTALRVGLDVVFRLVVPVTYRKGSVTTGVTLSSLQAASIDDSLVVRMAAHREGNGAYLGTAEFTVLAEDGTAVREWSVPLAIHYEINRRFVFRGAGLEPGSYRLAFRLSTEREDLADDHVIPGPTVGDTVVFAVPQR
jgi:P pilus assembly chaperone PapD